MKAEDILREPERLERKMRILAEEIAQIRASLQPGGVDYAADRVQGGGNRDKYPAAMDRIIEREKRFWELDARRTWLTDIRIPELLELVSDDRSRDVLRCYYICRHSLREVAEIVHWSVPTVNRLRRQGLADIDTHLHSDMY